MVIPVAFPAHTTASQQPAPQISGCNIFPSDNIWNVRVDNLPVDPRSASYINTIGANAEFHMDFGSGLWDGAPIGIPFITVPGTQPKVRVTFRWPDESDAGPYPIPANVPIEGGPNGDGDRHVLVLDRDNCILYELYNAWPQPDGSWRADSGAIYNLNSHALRPAGWTSADAAGLPLLPGLVRYSEVASGYISHALRFTVPQTRQAYIWPARHFASDLTGLQYPPMGQRFRLKADYNIARFSPQARVIARAMQEYGIILADNGSSWYVSGAPDAHWNNDILHQLDVLTGADFEAVDVSSLMITPNSGQAKIANPPAAPTGLSAAAVSATQINVTWQDNSSDETQFRIERSLAGTSAWSQIRVLGANRTSFSNIGLSCGTTYQYRVRAYRDGQFSNYSNTRSGTTQACTIPGLSTPGNNALLRDTTPTFLWNAVAGATQYRIQIDNNQDFSSPVVNVIRSTTQFTPTLNNGRFYWRVRAGGTGGVWSVWSPAWSIAIDTTPPAVPNLTAPGNGAVIHDNTPDFIWQASQGANRYKILVDNNSDFSSPVIQLTTDLTRYTHPSPLGDQAYHWRVRARDAAGNWSTWSPSRSFTLSIPIVQPTPTNTATATPVPTATPTEAILELLYSVESDDPTVKQIGTWTIHDTDAASSGRYLYSSGSTDDALTLTFTGTQVGIEFVKHPALGLLAVEIDGILQQTLETTADTSIFGEQVIVTGLINTIHTLRIYPVAGVIAVDAFLLDQAPVIIEPTATIIPTLQPTLMPTVLPTDLATGTPTETVVVTEIPTATSTETHTPVPTEPPTSTSTETPTETPLPTDLPMTIPAEATEPVS